MVAEPVAEAAVESEVVEPIAPNTTPEAEVVEPEDNFEDVLELLNQPEEGEDAGAKPAAEAITPAKPKTETEIAKEVEDRLRSESAAENTKRVRTAQIEGMRKSYQEFNGDIQGFLVDPTLTEAERALKIQNRTAQHNGHWNELYQNDVQQAHLVGVEGVRTGVIQAVASTLGKEEAEAVLKADHQSWEAYLEDVGERYAKKKGYLPPTEATKKFSDGQRDTLAKLKKLGIELPRGGEAKSIGTARSGPNTRMTKEAFEALPINEQLLVPAAERARIYGAVPR